MDDENTGISLRGPLKRINTDIIGESNNEDGAEVDDKGQMKPFKIRSYGKQTVQITAGKKKSPKPSTVQPQAMSKNMNARSKGTLTDQNDEGPNISKVQLPNNSKPDGSSLNSASTVNYI